MCNTRKCIVLGVLGVFLYGCGSSSATDFVCKEKSCSEMKIECGVVGDGCGEKLDCGQCSGDLVCSGYVCKESSGKCEAKSCESLFAVCGEIDDGCGKKINCGQCDDDKVCRRGACVKQNSCEAKDCVALDAQCGEIDDGCGKKIDCGQCGDGKVCNASKKCVLESECEAKDCAALDAQCGEIDDGCGKKIDCGKCGDGKVCNASKKCVLESECEAKDCAALDAQCGEVDDGCGKKIDCGKCGEGKVCNTLKKCENSSGCIGKSCADLGAQCGELDDGCGKKIDCGKCGEGKVCELNKCKGIVLDYPKRKTIKGLQPDFWHNINEIIGNEVGGVAMNTVWEIWQPSLTTQCDASLKYDGYCFKLDLAVADAIKKYSDAGIVVTAIVYGVPIWARVSCKKTVGPEFCAPKPGKEVDYGRFAGFLAHYFNGKSGHGLISDFVIHNEVNASEWFNYGCIGRGCSLDEWVKRYAASYNAAYDAITAVQPNAKVLFSFEHHFGSNFDSLMHSEKPVVSVETFLKKLIPLVGNRKWRVAFHSYPPNLEKPVFGADDWPKITFGNIGILAGWLRQHYPTHSHAWEIQLTENGINGRVEQREAQRDMLCQAFQNVLGTPGIESFIYHRMKDHKAEGGLQLGLVDLHEKYKPAWTLFALANRSVPGGYPRCGFQYLPYVRLQRYYSSSKDKHWTTTRLPPAGFHAEKFYCDILREEEKGKEGDTQVLYECRVGGAKGSHAMVSKDPNCENQFNMGPLGYVYKKQVNGTKAFYRCRRDKPLSHFISPDPKCEGHIPEGEGAFGYAHCL